MDEKVDLHSIGRTLKKGKSRAKIINATFVSLFTTPCKLVCKGGIYHFCPWRQFLFTCSSISRHWELFFQNRSRKRFPPKAALMFNHVWVKRQTRICTTWPSFPPTCRLLFIISTHNLVVSPNFSSIRIFWAGFICLFSILRNPQLETNVCRLPYTWSLNSTNDK